MIGRAGQGKSQLLQSLSGLTSQEIPSGDRSHCTGVRSTIQHSPGSETHGTVSLHSEQSFLNEIIGEYYKVLQLGSRPLTLEEFAKNPLPPLPAAIAGQAEYGAIYEHLRKYHVHCEEYRPLLREASPRRISQQEIRQYVAQDTPDGQRTYFNYLAVKEAKIFCRFPNEDIGQIALIDMPGLGDTGLGDAERMVRVLGQDVDVVLFVRMPRPPRDFWADMDVALYDTARSALVELPIELWSFLVLNRTEAGSAVGDNAQYCQDLYSNLQGSHIRVADCITANCKDPVEANQAILDRVLDYLQEKIAALDQQYASTCQQRLHVLNQGIAIELEKAANSLGQQAPSRDDWFPTFLRLFNHLWGDLTSGLEMLLKELREVRDQQDIDFEQEVQAALKACRQDTGIPTLGEIESLRDKKGAYGTAYNESLDRVRTHLSKKFLAIDYGLKQSLNSIKLRVGKVLMKQGRLDKLAPGTEGPALIAAIEQQIPDHLEGLKLGFQILSEFQLSYRGLIQHRIRQHLDRLTPDVTPLKLSASPSAEEILENLEELHGEVMYACEEALGRLLCEPSQAAYAIVEEFVDRVLRAEHVQDEWQTFMVSFRSEIWADEFEKLGENSRLRKLWLDEVEACCAANQSELIEFTN